MCISWTNKELNIINIRGATKKKTLHIFIFIFYMKSHNFPLEIFMLQILHE